MVSYKEGFVQVLSLSDVRRNDGLIFLGDVIMNISIFDRI